MGEARSTPGGSARRGGWERGRACTQGQGQGAQASAGSKGLDQEVRLGPATQSRLRNGRGWERLADTRPPGLTLHLAWSTLNSCLGICLTSALPTPSTSREPPRQPASPLCSAVLASRGCFSGGREPRTGQASGQARKGDRVPASSCRFSEHRKRFPGSMSRVLLGASYTSPNLSCMMTSGVRYRWGNRGPEQ